MLSFINKGHVSIYLSYACPSFWTAAKSVMHWSIWSFNIPSTLLMTPPSICTFENFKLLSTSILINKTCLSCWKDLMVLVQISHPTWQDSNSLTPQERKETPFLACFSSTRNWESPLYQPTQWHNSFLKLMTLMRDSGVIL